MRIKILGSAAQIWMQEAVTVPFEAGEALCRAALLRLTDERYIWFVNQHHLVTDAWSCKLLLATMDRIYHDDSTAVTEIQFGRPEAPHANPLFEQAQEYWQQAYRSVPQQDAIFGRLNTARDSTSNRLNYELDPEQTAQLQAVAEREFPAISPSMSLFVAFSALLVALVSRVSHRRRIGFEAPFGNRATMKDQTTAGLFIELFPLAADVDGTSSFCDLGRQIQNQVPAILKFGMLDAREPSANNGCDAVLNFIPFQLGNFGDHPVSAEYVHPGAHDAAHVLRLQVWDLKGDGGLTIMFDMNRTVISETDQATVVDYFKSLLGAFLEQPKTRIASIPLLSDAHRAWVLDRFNETSPQQPRKPPDNPEYFRTGPSYPDGSASGMRWRASQLRRIDSESGTPSLPR